MSDTLRQSGTSDQFRRESERNVCTKIDSTTNDGSPMFEYSNNKEESTRAMAPPIQGRYSSFLGILLMIVRIKMILWS